MRNCGRSDDFVCLGRRWLAEQAVFRVLQRRVRRACEERNLSVGVNCNKVSPTGSTFMVGKWRSLRSRRRWLSRRGTRRCGDDRQCRLAHGVTVECRDNGSPDFSRSFNTCCKPILLIVRDPLVSCSERNVGSRSVQGRSQKMLLFRLNEVRKSWKRGVSSILSLFFDGRS